MSQITISPENKLQNILDFDVCKKILADAVAKGDKYIILCGHYSINIASKYEDGEELQWDLDELGEYLGGIFLSVSDFDDLVIDLSSEDEDENNEDDNDILYHYDIQDAK